MTGRPSLDPGLQRVKAFPGASQLRPIPPAARATSAVPRQLRDLTAVGLILLFGLLVDDAVASVGLAVLFLGWKYLSREPGPPIVAAAFTMQWLQVMVALVYFAISTRKIGELRESDYGPMVFIGLASIAVLFGGVYFAAGFPRFKMFREGKQRLLPWSTNRIAVVYLSTVAGSGILQELAWSASGLTQPLLVLSRVRYVLLYLLVTRLIKVRVQWPWIVGLLVAELMLGFSGFFAEFREPLVIVAIAVLGGMDRRRTRPWVIVGSLAVLGVLSAVIWTGIKPIIRKDYTAVVSRAERLETALAVTGATFTLGGSEWKQHSDWMISRIWAIYFPALALKRVPSIVPHQNGAILWGAVQNVLTPRLFFPDKAVLPSQSDEVRKYAGVWVAGRETNTSYAFGYAAESYVDFGVPLMFLPILLWGLMVGFAYRWLRNHIRYDELRTGVTIVIVWSTLGAYESSWVMMIGPTLTILAVLGGGAILVDKFLRVPGRQRPHRADRVSSPLTAEGYRLK
jgi:hypothetical protein